MDRAKLSELGISPQVIMNALAQQNDMTPGGMVETDSDNVYVRVSGQFDDVDASRQMPANAGGKVLLLGDSAKVVLRFELPAAP